MGILPSETSAESDPQEQEPLAGSTRRDESVYLEERNRLLAETVRRQQPTIERQTARIDRLEQELEQAREQLIFEEHPDGGQPGALSLLDRVRRWLLDQ